MSFAVPISFLDVRFSKALSLPANIVTVLFSPHESRGIEVSVVLLTVTAPPIITATSNPYHPCSQMFSRNIGSCARLDVASTSDRKPEDQGVNNDGNKCKQNKDVHRS